MFGDYRTRDTANNYTDNQQLIVSPGTASSNPPGGLNPFCGPPSDICFCLRERLPAITESSK